jgi:hypothetical protein
MPSLAATAMSTSSYCEKRVGRKRLGEVARASATISAGLGDEGHHDYAMNTSNHINRLKDYVIDAIIMM